MLANAIVVLVTFTREMASARKTIDFASNFPTKDTDKISVFFAIDGQDEKEGCQDESEFHGDDKSGGG